MNVPNQKQFLESVKSHTVTALLDNGVYRHLHCTKGSIDRHFDIVTYPGNLVISGDMGCFVFKRVNDMFNFFRMDDNDFMKGNVINPGYWNEKVEAGETTEWDNDAFRENVNQVLQNWLDDAEDNEHDEEFIEEQKEKVSDLLDDIGSEWEAVSAINDWDADEYGVDFEDFWESSCNRATYHYIWCCYAIVWAISQYDKSKEAEALIQQPGQ
ncbi:hypothetical protein VPHK250G1_0030 [Vibrio phage K250 g1]